ncbi:hypothetical protein AQUCO_06600026v1 [Aquilegia coerulea]|uniref:Uncharacterized protein n=1 Tax=Aquilegia coerulea TaxID=218851 RepID=A0A2G5CC28_AQUCA|nr:hypothetical protein AQUCO_06600026v1 [Aquilegia coerulea]
MTLLDLPGIIEGAKDGKGRGRQESRTLKRKQDENISTLDATNLKVPRLNECTTRSHTRGKKCVSRRSEVEILKDSVGKLTPILNPTTTRARTRSLERQRRNNREQTRSVDNHKMSLDIPKASRVRRPVIEKKPEVTESETRKRALVENISNFRIKAPKLKNASPHTTY